MSRYLTVEEKESTVNFWLRSRGSQKPTSDLAREHIVQGGYDWPDPPIFPYTDRMNALDGVCTISSCMGHEWLTHTETPQYGEGHVWFRLSEKNTKIFDKYAIELVREETVVTVRRSYNLAYSTHFWEWYEIEFRGGYSTLADNVEPVLGFFERHFPAEVHPLPEGNAAAEPDALRPLPAADLETAGAET